VLVKRPLLNVQSGISERGVAIRPADPDRVEAAQVSQGSFAKCSGV
jgi:hypothetical protein